MLRTVVENRAVLSFLLSSGAGYSIAPPIPVSLRRQRAPIDCSRKAVAFRCRPLELYGNVILYAAHCILIDICTAVHLCGQDPEAART